MQLWLHVLASFQAFSVSHRVLGVLVSFLVRTFCVSMFFGAIQPRHGVLVSHCILFILMSFAPKAVADIGRHPRLEAYGDVAACTNIQNLSVEVAHLY